MPQTKEKDSDVPQIREEDSEVNALVVDFSSRVLKSAAQGVGGMAVALNLTTNLQ